MQTTQTSDLRSVLVYGALASVIPLVFFPRQWGLDLHWSFWGVAAGELALYGFIWWLVFPQRDSQTSFILLFQTALLRCGCGVLFGVLTFILAGKDLGQGIKSGLFEYTPAILIQVLAAPIIIKSVLLNRGRRRRLPRPTPAANQVADWTSVPKGVTAEQVTGNWDEILSYVKDYTGVEGCYLVDQDGLIVAQRGNPHLEGEALAPLAQLLENACLTVLGRVGEKEINRIETYTPRLRLSLHQVLNFRLLVFSDRRADDLLNVRIQRVIEQVTKKLTEKYPSEVLSAREGEYVRDTGRT